MNAYDIVVHANAYHLITAVNEKMKDGFVPIGGITIMPDGLVGQPMVKLPVPTVETIDEPRIRFIN